MDIKVNRLKEVNLAGPVYVEAYYYVSSIYSAEESSNFPGHTCILLMPEGIEIVINEKVDSFKNRVDQIFDDYEEKERAARKRDDLGF